MAKKRTATRKTRKNVVEVDFTDVGEGGGGGFHIAEGEYEMEVDSVEQGVSNNDNDQFAWVFKGTEGKAKGKTFYFYTPLVDQSLWKLRETLMALGVEVPDGPMDVDLDELVGLTGVGIVEDDEYRGKVRSKLAGFSIEEQEEEPEPVRGRRGSAAGKKTAGKKKTKVAKDEVKEMSEEELGDLVEKYGLECDLDEHKILRRKQAAVITALEEADLLDA